MTILQDIVAASESFASNQLILKLVTAAIILLIGMIVGRIAGRMMLKFLRKIEFDKTIRRATSYTGSLAKMLSDMLSYLIYFVAILMFLESLGLTPLVLNFIFVIVLVIIGISMLLAIKDFIPNFVAGYTIRRNGLFKVGSRIKVGEVQGKIAKMSLLDTHVKTSKDDLMVIPNSYFIRNVVVKKKR